MRKRCVVVFVGIACFACAVFADAYEPPKAELPLTLYGDCDEEIAPPFVASGWMGNIKDIEMDQCWDEYAHSGGSCIKVTFKGQRGWGGVVWSDPPNDWGDEPGGWDLTGATNLSFWARGHEGGERVEFKMGILRAKKYPDSARATTGKIRLDTAWTHYSIPLTGLDLRCIKTGFVWIVAGQQNPVSFYIDDIQYE